MRHPRRCTGEGHAWWAHRSRRRHARLRRLSHSSRHLAHTLLLRRALQVHKEHLHALQHLLTDLASLDAVSDLRDFGEQARAALCHLFTPLRVVDLREKRHQPCVERKLGRVYTWRQRRHAHWRPDTVGSTDAWRHGHPRANMLLSWWPALRLLEVGHCLRHLLLVLW